MKTLLVVFLAIFAAAQAATMFDSMRVEWSAFKDKHNKNYDSIDEEKLRMKIFIQNKELIAEHNRKYEAGLVSYKLGLNKYADLHHAEFVRKMNGLKNPSGPLLGSEHRQMSAIFIAPENVKLPSSIDWRRRGAVTPIKDQEDCGSCWAFAAAGGLEGQHFRKTGKLIELSEQNLVDCSGAYGNYGCNGGLPSAAFEYIKDNKGIDTEWSYPYEAEDGKCRYTVRNRGATDFGYVKIREGDEEALKAAVATVGPITIGIDGSLGTFQLYEEGVYHDPECSNVTLDHGVLLIGYGTEKTGEDYWLVKNSWSTDWGLDGYVKIARNRKNLCGVATLATYPLV